MKPLTMPNRKTRFLSPRQVCELTTMSRSSLDREVAAGNFPKPIKLTQRRMAYNEEDVENWMRSKVAA